jgi:hypothetical protein
MNNNELNVFRFSEGQKKRLESDWGTTLYRIDLTKELELTCQHCYIAIVVPRLVMHMADLDILCHCGKTLYINPSPGR